MIRENLVEELSRLKEQQGKAIVLSCGPDLLAPLAQQPGLIDQYLIVVHPAILGTGKHLFRDVQQELPLQLLETKVFDGGCVVLRYQHA